ncbi:MAG: 4Fe-4S binding protein [Acidobacteriota bacterium]|nr:4Fe-4S binding protein [Acidobacteriota bacterium]
MRKQDCVGCGACMQVCSRNAIEMASDDEGFLYPVIDEARCVRCRMCSAVCPIGAAAGSSSSLMN